MNTATNNAARFDLSTIDGINAMLDATQGERPAVEAAPVKSTVGKCQICERQFKIDGAGRISMHGHQRAGRGRAAGFCPGSAFQAAPNTDALAEQVAKFRAEDAVRYAGIIGKYEARIAALTAARR